MQQLEFSFRKIPFGFISEAPFKRGDYARVVSPYWRKNQIVKILQVDPPYTGVTWRWVTARLPEGSKGLFSSDELRLVE